MRTPLHRTGPPERRTSLRAKGGSRFPKRRDPAFMAWLLDRLREGVRCQACGVVRAQERAHLDPKGSGGLDRGNVVLLCGSCHRRQEKRNDAFCRETGVDLRAAARAWAMEYEAERECEHGVSLAQDCDPCWNAADDPDEAA